MPKLDKRSQAFHMLLTEDERQWLHELAAEGGVSAAQVLRSYIRSEHIVREAPRRPTKKRAPKNT
jgi:hypothetical protein